MTNTSEVWKKQGNNSYQHISSFKPSFQTSIYNVSCFTKSITFTDKVIPDKDTGVLSTGIMYTQGKDVYEIDCNLPLESFYDDEDDDEDNNNKKDSKGVSTYGDAFKSVENKLLKPKWTYQGETITKIIHLGEGEDISAIVMVANGSLAWFRDGVVVPIHIMQEFMGPGMSFSPIHSINDNGKLTVSDFDLSIDYETVVKSHSNMFGDGSIIKIIDNSGKPGELLRKIRVPGTTVTHSVRFFDNHLFATCSDDNIIRFWDTRTGGDPLWTLSDPNNGALTSFDASSVVDTLFATGSDTGIVKLWDVRAVSNAAVDLSNRQNGEDPIQDEVVTLHHSGGDSVVDIKFSFTSPSELVTIGGTGNVYHWDMESFFSQYDDDNEDVTYSTDEDVKAQCLKFLHTGGSRRALSHIGKRNTVAWHSLVSDLITTVDDDCLITVYKPYAA